MKKNKDFWQGFDFACQLYEDMGYDKSSLHHYMIADCLKAKMNRMPKNKIRKKLPSLLIPRKLTIHKPKTMKTEQELAKQILLVRDALVNNDIQEAYHQLYKIASPNFYKKADFVWKEIEDLAKQEHQQPTQDVLISEWLANKGIGSGTNITFNLLIDLLTEMRNQYLPKQPTPDNYSTQEGFNDADLMQELENEVEGLSTLFKRVMRNAPRPFIAFKEGVKCGAISKTAKKIHQQGMISVTELISKLEEIQDIDDTGEIDVFMLSTKLQKYIDDLKTIKE